MSGPITLPTGTDGVMWLVREDLGAPMVVPPDPHGLALTPPDYFTGTLPYYGDWQIRPVGSPSTLALVIEFETPIQQFRTTAQFVSPEGLKMYAAVEEPTHDPFIGPIFAAVASEVWAPLTSGTRTLTYAPGFRYVILGTIGVSSPLLGILGLGPTFRNTFFEETITVAEPVVVAAPEQRVPHGAGRIISYSWPDLAYPGNAQPANILARGRFGGVQTMVATQAAPQPEANTNLTYKGQRCLRVSGRNGTGWSFTPLQGGGRPFGMYPALERPATDFSALDEIAVYRLQALLAFDQPAGPLANGCGLVIGQGTATRVRGSTGAGIALGLTNIGTVALTTRQVTNGAQLEHALALPDGFDVTAWHLYELRIVSATQTSEAILRVLVDGVVVLELSWGAGSVLPLPYDAWPIAAGTHLGYLFTVLNLGGTPDFIARMYIAEGGIGYHVAMTEDALE